MQGYVPPLMATGRQFGRLLQNDKFGFAVYLYHPINVFNGLYARGGRGEWATKGETRDFWIQIKCPDLVRLWMINNNPICKVPECQKTSVALADMNKYTKNL